MVRLLFHRGGNLLLLAGPPCKKEVILSGITVMCIDTMHIHMQVSITCVYVINTRVIHMGISFFFCMVWLLLILTGSQFSDFFRVLFCGH